MFPTSPASLFDNFPSSPNIFDYNEDIFSFNSYSDEIPSKPDLSDINQICSKNKYAFEIFGYLIYLLIENELCDIKDMNIFINKDEESKINICKTIKYIISSLGFKKGKLIFVIQ